MSHFWITKGIKNVLAAVPYTSGCFVQMSRGQLSFVLGLKVGAY